MFCILLSDNPEGNWLVQIFNSLENYSPFNQFMVFVILLIIAASFLLWFVIKFVKPTIDTNKFVKEVNDKIDNLKKDIANLEVYKTKFLLSKIFNIDITFQSIDDELLLSNLDNEINNPISEIDYLLKGLINISKLKKDKTNDKYKTKAIDYISKAIEVVDPSHIDPKFLSECYNYLGVVYDEIENYEKAIAKYKLSITKNESNPKPYYNIACSYAKILEKTIEKKEKDNLVIYIKVNLKKALKLNPEDYLSVIKDTEIGEDLQIIKEKLFGNFFDEIINETAKTFHSCNSFNVTTITN